jgi:hypothetical protein
MRLRRFAPGDWVLYRKLKFSASPGPRARHISAATNGDEYSYFVVKYWIVDGILPDGLLKLRTRQGKTHLIEHSDPNLRRVSWWKRWIYKDRFRAVERGRSPMDVASTQRGNI